MKQGMFETIVGVVVLIVTIAFFTFAYRVSNYSELDKGYHVVANFQNIDGILNGADVKIAGIKVGSVDNISLDDETYYAAVQLQIRDHVSIPKDSTAIVSTCGLLGGKYIKITPGASDDILAKNGKIRFTQSALNIEELIGKLMYSLTSK
ncbi:MAG: outer membrane lipid asymmetry maintenance protein MlaD [Rickettsiaceae bacterium]